MKKKLKNKIYHAFLIGFAITILGSAFAVFGVAFHFVYQNSLQAEQELTEHIAKSIDDYIQQINTLCIQVSYTSSTRNVLEKFYDGQIENRMEYNRDADRMSQLYQDFLRAFNGVDGIFIYNLYGYPYYFTTSDRVYLYNNIQEESWYRQLINSSDYNKIVVSDIHTPPQLASGNMIALYRNIRDLNKHEIIGQAEIHIRPKALRSLLTDSAGQISQKRNLTLIDHTGQVICSSQNYETGDLFDPDIFSQFVGKSSSSIATAASGIASCHYSEFTGWYLINEYNSDLLYRNLYIIIIIFICFSLLALTAMTIWSRILSRQITKPVILLMEGVHHLKEGDFNYSIPLISNDEFRDLANAFNEMAKDLQQSIQQIRQAEQQKSEAEMTALQAQINPHFTLNTINSVKHMAMLQNSVNIVTMLDDFSLLLAATFRHPNELITIGEELERIRAFIRIQEISSFGKIKFHFQYKPELVNFLTIGLILQPIVENAIFHGIKPKMSSHQMESGNIMIHLQTEGDDIIIHVIDDGIGMPQETADHILSENNSGIGIRNVHLRIRLRFGNNYGLQIKSAPGQGCNVQIRIPQIK